MPLKHTIRLVLALIGLCALIFPVSSHALTASLQYQHVIYDDSELEPSGGLRLSLCGKRFSLGLSYESTLLVLGGQEAVDIDLWGLGLGARMARQPFTLQFGLSYYFPDIEYRGAFREAMWLHVNHIYPEGAHDSYNSPDEYAYELHGGLGSHIKLSAEHELCERLWLNISLGYRYLRLTEHYVRDHRAYNASSWVEFINYRDFSGGIVFVGVAKKF